MATTVKKVLILTFNTSTEDVTPQITLSKPVFGLEQVAIANAMDAIIASGVFAKKEVIVTAKKSAAYKTTTTDDITLV